MLYEKTRLSYILLESSICCDCNNSYIGSIVIKYFGYENIIERKSKQRYLLERIFQSLTSERDGFG